MHRTDNRSPLRFLLVQFPAFVVGLYLCVSGISSVQVWAYDLSGRGMTGLGDMVVLVVLGVFCLVLGLELWRLDRPRK